jgi:hypothetical protein
MRFCFSGTVHCQLDSECVDGAQDEADFSPRFALFDFDDPLPATPTLAARDFWSRPSGGPAVANEGP